MSTGRRGCCGGNANDPIISSIVSPLDAVKVLTVVPVLDTTPYGAGDVLGGLQTFTWGYTFRTGLFNGIEIIDKANQNPSMTLFLFDSQPGAIANNSPISGLSSADQDKIMATILLNPFVTPAGASWSYSGIFKTGVLFSVNPLYAYLITNAAATYAASSLTLRPQALLQEIA